MSTPQRRTLLDFDSAAEVALWAPVDDVVMGGVSRSRFALAEPGIATFSGVVSLDQGGGFASVRTRPASWPTDGAVAFVLRVRGDGHTYKLTLRTDAAFDGVQYQARFAPPRGEWIDVQIPVDAFLPSFRGRIVRDAPPLEPSRIRALGLMISDRQAGPFELLVDSIAAIGPCATS